MRQSGTGSEKPLSDLGPAYWKGQVYAGGFHLLRWAGYANTRYAMSRDDIPAPISKVSVGRQSKG